VSKLRILHCLRAPVGGLFRHVRDLAREQERHGHEVGLLCDTSANDPLTAELLTGLETDLSLGILQTRMPREIGFSDVSAARFTTRIAHALQIDVLHGHGAKGGAYARLAGTALRRRGLSVSSFYTPHGGSLHYSPSSLKGRLFMAAERQFARATAGIVFESTYAARVYAANVGTPVCPVRVIHNGIRPDEMLPVEPAPEAADFVFVGELRLLKGVDLLIEAAAAIVAKRPCRIAIVGAGPDAGHFRARAEALGLTGSVTFPGAMPARDAFRLGRALVLPSRAESLPYVALEAAGAGLPIIATAVGGIPEIVEGTDTKLVAAGDVMALAEAMQAVLDAPEAYAGRARRLEAAVGHRFSVEAMARGVLEFYAEARGEKSVRSSARQLHRPVEEPAGPPASTPSLHA
jgi:glycosyltransferase involved in cell wall biosynthesis